MEIIRTAIITAFVVLGLYLAIAPIQFASAASFWVTGKITRTAADHELAYGGCMIHLDVALPAPCPANGWVSLDCTATYHDLVSGNNKLSSALTALSMDRHVAIYVNDQNKHNGYCVARRVDILSY